MVTLERFLWALDQLSGIKEEEPEEAPRNLEVEPPKIEEEEIVFLPDIRDPKVRAEVKRIQAEQEKRLEERLIAAGLHILQKKSGSK